MCDDKYGSPLKPPISTFELNTDGLSLNEQIKLMESIYIKMGDLQYFQKVQKNLLFRLFMSSFKRKTQSTMIFYKKQYGSNIILQCFQIH